MRTVCELNGADGSLTGLYRQCERTASAGQSDVIMQTDIDRLPLPKGGQNAPVQIDRSIGEVGRGSKNGRRGLVNGRRRLVNGRRRLVNGRRGFANGGRGALRLDRDLLRRRHGQRS